MPTKVIFLIGISKNGDNYNNKILKHEANQNQDLLQEDFIDTYNNLTLKSMFMLKYAQSLSTVGNFSMSLKVNFLISFFKPFLNLLLVIFIRNCNLGVVHILCSLKGEEGVRNCQTQNSKWPFGSISNDKGQLTSKCPFGVIIWTKITMKKLANFCPIIWKVVKSMK